MRKEWFGISLVAFCFVLIYFPALHFPFFIFDDSYHITSRPEVIAPSWQNAINFWVTSRTPIIFNIWQLISSAFGVENPQPYRIINYLVHLINLFLVFKITSNILSRFFKENQKETMELAACVGVLFFGMHPVLVESLVWVSSLRTTLSATFGFLSILFYLKTLEKDEPYLEVTISFVFLVIGTLIKPGIVSLFLVYPFLDLALFNQPLKKSFSKNIIFFLFVLVVWAIHTSGAKGVGKIDLSLHKKVFIIVKSTIFYLTHTLLPLKTQFVYAQTFESELKKSSGVSVYEILSMIGLLLGYLYLLMRKNLKIYFVLATLFILILFPHLGIVTFDYQQLTLFSDRYLYFPLLVFAIFVAVLVLQFSKFKFAWGLALIIYGSFLFGSSFTSVSKWKNSSTVLASSLEENQENEDYIVAYINSLVIDRNFSTLIQLITDKNFPTNKIEDLLINNDSLATYLDDLDSLVDLRSITYRAKDFSPKKLSVLRRTNHLLATHEALKQYSMSASKEAVEKEAVLLNNQTKDSLAEAYAIMADIALIDPDNNQSPEKRELAALRLYEMAIKAAGHLKDPVRAKAYALIDQKRRLQSNKKVSPKKD